MAIAVRGLRHDFHDLPGSGSCLSTQDTPNVCNYPCQPAIDATRPQRSVLVASPVPERLLPPIQMKRRSPSPHLLTAGRKAQITDLGVAFEAQ